MSDIQKLTAATERLVSVLTKLEPSLLTIAKLLENQKQEVSSKSIGEVFAEVEDRFLGRRCTPAEENSAEVLMLSFFHDLQKKFPGIKTAEDLSLRFTPNGLVDYLFETFQALPVSDFEEFVDCFVKAGVWGNFRGDG